MSWPNGGCAQWWVELGLGLLVGRTLSSDVSRVSVGQKSLGIPALEPTDCWMGLGHTANGLNKMSASRRVHADEYSLMIMMVTTVY